MRTLIRFFIKHHLLFMFLLLEAVAIVSLIQHNYRQRLIFAKAEGALLGSLHEKTNNWLSYLSLDDANSRLHSENIRLRNSLPDSYYEDSVCYFQTIDSMRTLRYVWREAEVINCTVNRQYNYITLNKGSEHNIAEGMAVVGPEGIAGIVYGVSEHFSTVLPVINRKFRLSAKFLKNDFFGSLQWDGRSYRMAELNEIPLHAPVAVGDTIVVTGFASSFPEGTPVGIVANFDKKDGNFYSIEVELFTDYRRLYHVSVVENLMQSEQTKLEQQTLQE